MQISERLRMVASFVTVGNRVADIGTDHGYVPLLLLSEGKIPSAIGMDINKGPLEHARKNRDRFGLRDVFELRVSDGLQNYRAGETESIVIAGMGGELMIRILKEGKDRLLQIKELVLSPQSEIEGVRKYLAESGFTIARERMMKEDGKYYVVMRAVPGVCDYKEPYEFLYGKRLLEEADAVTEEFLSRESVICEELIASLPEEGNERLKTRKAVLSDKLTMISQAQNCLQIYKSRI